MRVFRKRAKMRLQSLRRHENPWLSRALVGYCSQYQSFFNNAGGSRLGWPKTRSQDLRINIDQSKIWRCPCPCSKHCWLKAWSDPREGKCFAWLIKGQKVGQDSWELQKSAPTTAAMQPCTSTPGTPAREEANNKCHHFLWFGHQIKI